MNLGGILTTSRSGLNGMQKSLDNIANNIANVDTVGYKSRDTSFRELLNNQVNQNEVGLSQNAGQIGLDRGLEVDQESINQAQGALKKTSSPYDLAITGQGYFGVYDQSGQFYLTRAGNFQRNAAGELVNQAGDRLAITTTVPQAQWPQGDVKIAADGTISIQQGANATTVGKIPLYQPQNMEDLQTAGNNRYRVVNGGTLLATTNGDNLGTINQYALENSTVELAGSMADMITTQRAYALNAKVLQSTDDMLGTVNRFSE
ncbi:flagellar hook-basal body protein [Liquorilactobacillus satsumensis]|uniref:flagellar hook-basal body protein n=1 Tax=Liquorilactobacillus satsumensis TaxID=259059 RepID=UPI0021C36540|nr:flagellar hook-basal body protein [Liquorilactobacillus satsumensis]MCP9312861.1 flagellar hook-basal body protein [Liquorilactobacillus satsumensis]MCP9329270.1 flagellar hook-basal body protein [Liquorilactobacillus satsumensis]MCP9359957.1 flagellar hook-basal body protein [Liquorilactobacillus satsumensis]